MNAISITNHSVFPMTYLRVLSRFVLKEIGINRRYRFTFWNHRSWSGRAYGYNSSVKFNRHFRRLDKWPYTFKDHRYSWSHEYQFGSRTELFVFLMAHEAAHDTEGSRKDHVRSFWEYRADDKAYEVVKKYREQKKELWDRIRTGLRTEARREKDRESREIKHKVLKSSPEFKMNIIRVHLKKWESKLKLAQTKIRLYRRKMKYYEKKLHETERGKI